MEIWKDIPEFEGIYQISTYGRVKSFKECKEGRILSNVNKKGGYLSLILRHRSTKRCTRVHRLVAEAFIPNPDNLPQVNHIDGNKQNNHIDNLEWVTPEANVYHAVIHNPHMIVAMNFYNKHMRPKPIEQYSLNGQFIAEFANSTEASVATGVCQRNILQVANQEEYRPGLTRKQAGGFIWKLRDKEKRVGNQYCFQW